MFFKLYPDCKLVKGKQADAIYDLTRNSIYIVSHACSKFFIDDETIDSANQIESGFDDFIEFLKKNELGTFNMPEEISNLSEEFIDASVISNAIIELGEIKLPINKIANELSELLCETVLLKFLKLIPLNDIISTTKIFSTLSMHSIEICTKYHKEIEDDIKSIIKSVPISTRIIITDSPYTKTENFLGVPIRFIKGSYSCAMVESIDYSAFANANHALFFESKTHNNCLNRKVVVDQYGNIKNCPEKDDVYGNIYNHSLRDIIHKPDFQRSWYTTIDSVEKCCDCELRYACHHCSFCSNYCTYHTKSKKYL